MYAPSRFSVGQSDASVATGAQVAEKAPMVNTTTIPQYLWDKDPDLDDALHNPDPVRDARLDRSCDPFSLRGWVNAGALIILLLALIMLFAGYPIYVYYAAQNNSIRGFNLGGINGTGQVPDLNLPSLIDHDTPTSAYTRTGDDGKKYNLVFSDEFNVDGRTFFPGEDPYWEAADLHYWCVHHSYDFSSLRIDFNRPTGDLEWYDPGVSHRCIYYTCSHRLIIS